MRRYIREHDVNRWARGFLADLRTQPPPD
jgi:trehalose-6-phosphate synthase